MKWLRINHLTSLSTNTVADTCILRLHMYICTYYTYEWWGIFMLNFFEIKWHLLLRIDCHRVNLVFMQISHVGLYSHGFFKIYFSTQLVHCRWKWVCEKPWCVLSWHIHVIDGNIQAKHVVHEIMCGFSIFT